MGSLGSPGLTCETGQTTLGSRLWTLKSLRHEWNSFHVQHNKRWHPSRNANATEYLFFLELQAARAAMDESEESFSLQNFSANKIFDIEFYSNEEKILVI